MTKPKTSFLCSCGKPRKINHKYCKACALDRAKESRRRFSANRVRYSEKSNLIIDRLEIAKCPKCEKEHRAWVHARIAAPKATVAHPNRIFCINCDYLRQTAYEPDEC